MNNSNLQPPSHYSGPTHRQQLDSVGSYGNSAPSKSSLSNEDFEHLIKSLQLLRIAPLRYIVQKFSIPATGNKSKLVQLVISSMNCLRYDPILSQILQEVNKLISQQSNPFSNPLSEVKMLTPVPYSNNWLTIQFPHSPLSPDMILFGPLLAEPPFSNGTFTFVTTLSPLPIIFDLLMEDPRNKRLSIEFNLNGLPYEIMIDDCYPSPIEISKIVNQSPSKNVLEVVKMTNIVPMMICIRHYSPIGLKEIVEKVVQKPIDTTNSQILCRGQECNHEETFNLIPTVAEFMRTGDWSCPICNQPITIDELIVEQIREYPRAQHNILSDPFGSGPFIWD
jgi:hypothetical protein